MEPLEVDELGITDRAQHTSPVEIAGVKPSRSPNNEANNGAKRQHSESDSSMPELKPIDAGEEQRASLLERLAKPTVEEAKLVSIVSISLTLFTFVLGMILAVIGRSAATLSYSLESLVDVLSSVLVLWRFWGHQGDEKRLALREKRASILIAFTLVIAAIVVFVTACIHLADRQEVTDTGGLLALAIPSFFVLMLLGFIKWHIAGELHSSAMRKDAVCSIAASLLSFAIFVSLSIQATQPSGWWIDAAFALLVSIGLFVYGGRSLLRNKWWTAAFWHPHLDGHLNGGTSEGISNSATNSSVTRDDGRPATRVESATSRRDSFDV